MFSLFDIDTVHKSFKNIIGPWLVQLSALSTGCEPKCHQFDSQSGHMPGVRARFPVGATRKETTH